MLPFSSRATHGVAALSLLLQMVSSTVATAQPLAGDEPAPGRVMGRLVDPTGRSVAGATLLLRGPGFTASATTNSQGVYLFTSVPSQARYTLRMTKSGYQSSATTVQISPDYTSRLSATLAESGSKPEPKPVPTEQRPAEIAAALPEASLDMPVEAAADSSAAGLPEAFEPPSVFVAVATEAPTIIGGLAALRNGLRYPSEARRRAVSGTVIVQTRIDEHGRPVDAVVLRPVDSSLDEAALAAVLALHFTPGRQGERPVATTVTLPVTFRLSVE